VKPAELSNNSFEWKYVSFLGERGQKYSDPSYIFSGIKTPTSGSTRRRRFRIDTEVRCVGAHTLFGPLSWRGLNPIKSVYNPDWPDGRLNLTASAFNQLSQYTSSAARRGYCYAELAVFFPSGGRNHRQYSLRLPTEGWPSWVGLGGWLRSEIVYLPKGKSPIPVLTGLDVEQLRWSRPTRYRYTKPPPDLHPCI